MESEVKALRRRAKALAVVVAVMMILSLFPVAAQEQPPSGKQEEPAQLQLRRTVKSRDYQGKTVEGEERVIRPRDNLWRILVVERGLPENRFARYVILIGALNPGVKRPDVLRVGDTLFIPLQPDQILGIKLPTEKEGTKLYQVKQGEHLYKILREQFGIQEAELQSAAQKVRELNPGKKNWNVLYAGEAILFPKTTGKAEPATAKTGEVPLEVYGLDYGQKISAQENLDLLSTVMAALGSETRREGEESLPLREGTIHIDRASYPVIYSSNMDQRVILDIESKMASALRSKLEAGAPGVPVVSVKKGASLHDVVGSLLSRLGFQSLPSDRPVVVQDRGVAVQVKGEWMATSPEQSSQPQQVLVISLTDSQGQTPGYLKDYLSLKGMSLKEILLPASATSPGSPPSGASGGATQDYVERWPADKAALVDIFLKDYGISFSNSRQLSIALREGIRIEAMMDRFFEHGGRKMALSFRPVGEDIKKALQEREGLQVVELDLPALPSRALVARLLAVVGEKAAYREHRFQANEGAAKDKLVLTVPGFLVASRSLLLTDREIPKELERFFGEKGMRVVRFQ